MRGEFPYKNIGQRIRQWRQDMHESLAEVSGAVEIDSEQLAKIEKGVELPSEEILLLLISYLDVSEKDATTILEQAGYVRPDKNGGLSAMDEQIIKQTLMIIPFDNRILYSDSVNISATPNGVVMDFLQTTSNPQPATIARIGMSLEHAARMQKLLNEIMSKTGKPPRQLEPPKNIKNQADQSNQN
jgi:transcriptional regulator with XRE-family HTH domain